jgi:hypothetical protein
VGAGDRVVEVARVATDSDDEPRAPGNRLPQEQLDLMK